MNERNILNKLMITIFKKFQVYLDAMDCFVDFLSYDIEIQGYEKLFVCVNNYGLDGFNYVIIAVYFWYFLIAVLLRSCSWYLHL
jgi:hypothetical protein